MDVLLCSVAALGIYTWCNHTPALVPGEKSLTFYYMKSCPHCKHMYPDMRRFTYRYKDIAIRWVEDRNNYEYEIHAFPTLIFRDASGTPEQYNGARRYADIKAYLDSK